MNKKIMRVLAAAVSAAVLASNAAYAVYAEQTPTDTSDSFSDGLGDGTDLGNRTDLTGVFNSDEREFLGYMTLEAPNDGISLLNLVNDPVFSGDRYYYQLDDDSRSVYDIICEKYKDGPSSDRVTLSITNEFYSVGVTYSDGGYSVDDESRELVFGWIDELIWYAMLAVNHDHPEMGWLYNSGFMYGYSWRSIDYTQISETKYNMDITVTPYFYFSSCPTNTGSSADMDSAVARVKKSLGFTGNESRYDIVKGIHDYLCETVTYNYDVVSSGYTGDNRVYQTAYSAFYPESGPSTVCAGYAKGFKVLCDSYDIPCIVISGSAGSGNDYEPHAWNYVKMDDNKWYAVDCTWDDQLSRTYYDFFLIGSETCDEHFGGYAFIDSHVANGKWDSSGSAVFAYPELSETKYVFTEPSGPKTLTATASSKQVTLKWDAVNNATGYIVKSADGKTQYTKKSITSNSYTVTGLTNGVQHKFRVYACIYGKWYSSPRVSVTTSGAPQNVTAKADNKQITLTWDKVNGATGYIVKSADGKTQYTKKSITTNSYTVKGLTNGTQYRFKVYACTDGKWFASSPKSKTPTAAPQNLTATAGSKQIKLTWDRVSGAKGYIIKSADGKVQYTPKTITANSYTVTGLTGGTQYKFKVYAYVDGKWYASAPKTKSAKN